jgi:hypothetical protein
MTDPPVLAAMDPVERLVVVRARSLARYARASGARSLEGHFEISAPGSRRIVPVLLLVHPPGDIEARFFPSRDGPAHEGRYPLAWLNQLDFEEGDAFLPRADLEEDQAANGAGRNREAPGTSRSPGAQHAATSGSGGEDPCQRTS